MRASEIVQKALWDLALLLAETPVDREEMLGALRNGCLPVEMRVRLVALLHDRECLLEENKQQEAAITALRRQLRKQRVEIDVLREIRDG